ncbi:Ig-like domain-containing protein, partial [Mycobacterium sp. 852002-51152_SCH6134967]|uniref:Ig-like domain-containing protein n=1 Tax=Mycobacterium sp. 852002-51152_SCH6134967 TaxID=1834096 RepID=UPI0018D572F4
TGTSSVANYQTALRSVTYRNTSDTPDATRTIAYTVNDGSTLSTPATKTVTVTAVNDVPTVTTTAGTTSYTEQAAPTEIDTGVTLADPDNTTLSGATVSIGNPSATETLSFTAPAGSGITGSYNSTTGQLTLTGTSSVANYQTTLRSVTYENTSDTPATTRTVTFTVNDGTAPSTLRTKTLTVTAVNDAPTITTTSGTTTYTEQAAPTAIDTGLTLTDPDNTTLSDATVSIGSANPTERLAFTAPTDSGITGSYNSATGVLTLTGTSSVANYQTALRSVTYENISGTSAAERTVTFTAGNSAPTTKTISIAAVNDAPTLDSCGCTVTANPNTAAKMSSTITINDADDATLDGATVAITSGLSSGDVLALNPNPLNGITGTYNATTGVLSLTGNASVGDYQTALRMVTFTSNGAAVDTERTIAFTVDDGERQSNTITQQVSIVAANQAPIAGTPVYQTDSITGVITGSVPFTDPDGGVLGYTAAPPIRGTITIDPTTGAFTYTPSDLARQRAAATDATDAEKQDIIVVLADDGQSGVTAVGITVDVVPANNVTNGAPIAGTPDVGTPGTSTGTVSGTVGFTDPDNDLLRYTVSSFPEKGSVSVDPTTGEFTYTPYNFPAFGITPRHDAAADTATVQDQTDTFTVTASDMRGQTTDVVVIVPISPANSKPQFQPAASSVSTADSSGSVTGSLLFFEGDNDALTFTTTPPTKGTLVVESSTNSTTYYFTYTPDETARQQAASPTASAGDLVDSFVLTADDGHGGAVSLTVAVAILPTGATPNSAPRIKSFVTEMGSDFDGINMISRDPATGVTAGIPSMQDPDGDSLTFTATQPAKGTVTVDPTTGEFIYTPSAASRHDAALASATDEDTRDTFNIVVADARGNATSIPVTMPIGMQNAKPLLNNVSAGVPDASTGIVTGQVTATDPDSDTITYVGPTTTAKGSVAVDRTTGAFTYTPAAAARSYAAAADATDADRFETFTVTAYDNHGGYVSTDITVAIAPSTAPNNAPTQTAPTTVGEPEPVTGEVSGHFNLSELDRDGITYTIEPIAGSRVEDGYFIVEDGRFTSDGVTGAWTFVPTDERRHEAALETGGRPDIYSFRWTATDSRGGVASGEVSVLISPANQSPVVGVPVQTTNPSTGAMTGRFTAYDPDGDYLDVSSASQPAFGTLTTEWIGGETYQWTYTPQAGQPSPSGFTLVVDDGHGGQRFLFTPLNPNAPTATDPPVRTGLSTNRPSDTTTGEIRGVVAVSNAAGQTLTYSVVDGTSTGGTVSLDSATGAYVFVPSADARYQAAAADAPAESLTAKFTVEVTDENGEVVELIPIEVPISPLNRPPTTQVILEPADQFGTFRGRVVVTDPDGDHLTIGGGTTSRLGGDVSISPGGTFTYTPDVAVRVAAAQRTETKDYFFVSVTEEHGRKSWVRVVVDVPPLTLATPPPAVPAYP